MCPFSLQHGFLTKGSLQRQRWWVKPFSSFESLNSPSASSLLCLFCFLYTFLTETSHRNFPTFKCSHLPNLPILGSITLVTFSESVLPHDITFTGSVDQHVVIIGGPSPPPPPHTQQNIIPQIYQVMGRNMRGEVGTEERIAPESRRKLENIPCFMDLRFQSSYIGWLLRVPRSGSVACQTQKSLSGLNRKVNQAARKPKQKKNHLYLQSS